MVREPTWLDKVPIGQWCRISGDRPDLDLAAPASGTRYLADNDPAGDPTLNPPSNIKERLRRIAGRRPQSPWHGQCGFSSITEAWNGAVLATRFGRSGSMVIFGGGHNDYFGSDIHAFDLENREWSRISDGFISRKTDDYGEGVLCPDAEYPDGSPLPPHTYGYVQYDPETNDFVLFKGQTELGKHVTAAAIPHMFNFDALSWRRGPKHLSAILNSGGCTAWDEKRRKIWGHSGDAGGGNAFLSFNPSGQNPDGTFGQWGEMFPNKLIGEADHNAMAIDPRRDIIVLALHSRDALCAIDPEYPQNRVQQLNSSTGKPRIREYAAIEYSPNLRSFVYYSAADGPALYEIAPPHGRDFAKIVKGKWLWKSLVSDENSLDPISDAASQSEFETNTLHTFGRFRIASYGDTDVAILVRHVDSPVYAMRIT